MEEPNRVKRPNCTARNIAYAIRMGIHRAEILRLDNAIKVAVAAGDAKAIGELVDVCRFKYSYTYNQTLARFQELTGISRDDFEQLMYQADAAESQEVE